MIFWGVLIIKLLLAYFFPLTGDESYFLQFGKHPAFYYYDHPPITGWIAYLSQTFLSQPQLFEDIFPLRLITLAYGLQVYLFLKTYSARLAQVFWLSPIHLLLVPYTTDTPLAILSLLGMRYLFAYQRVVTEKQLPPRDHPEKSQPRLSLKAYGSLLGSALFFSFAFLSKFLALSLGLGFVINIFRTFDFRVTRQSLTAFFVFAITSSLFPVIFLIGSFDHCGWPLSFLLFNRTQDAPYGWLGPVCVIVFALIVTFPASCAIFSKSALRESFRRATKEQTFFYSAILFLILTSFQETGLHWLIPAVPMGFVSLWQLSPQSIEHKAKWSGISSLVVLWLLISVFLIPQRFVQNIEGYSLYLTAVSRNELLNSLPKSVDSQSRLFAIGYVNAGILENTLRRPVEVFASLDNHGRNSDAWTDWPSLHGKDLFILYDHPKYAGLIEEASQVFQSVQLHTFEVRGQKMIWLEGRGFIYSRYHELFISKQLQMHYDPANQRLNEIGARFGGLAVKNCPLPNHLLRE